MSKELSESEKNDLIKNVTNIALRFYLDFDPKFVNMVEAFAHDLQVKPSFVCERLALAHYAEMSAEEELAGQPLPRALMEFTTGIDAEEFYQSWKAGKVKQLKNEEENMAELQRRYETVVSKYLQTSEGKAEHLESINKAKASYEARKANK